MTNDEAREYLRETVPQPKTQLPSELDYKSIWEASAAYRLMGALKGNGSACDLDDIRLVIEQRAELIRERATLITSLADLKVKVLTFGVALEAATQVIETPT